MQKGVVYNAHMKADAILKRKKVIVIDAIIIGALMMFGIFVIAWVWLSGSPVPRPTVSQGAMTIGAGNPLVYVVLGDSTAVSQGSAYSEGYAVDSAAYLAEQHAVTWFNLAQPGARAGDVAADQVGQAVRYMPDIVLIAAGANDVTHLTPLRSVKRSLQSAITALRKANPQVKIVLTGAPDMGSPRRIPPPLRQLAGIRTEYLNAAVRQLADGKSIVFAPIAEKTAPAFRANPELFASDKFHPNDAGYELWKPVIRQALNELDI